MLPSRRSRLQRANIGTQRKPNYPLKERDEVAMPVASTMPSIANASWLGELERRWRNEALQPCTDWDGRGC